MSMAMPAQQPARGLDTVALAVLVVLCASWGVQQVSVKFALAEVPPTAQMTIRCAGAALVVLIAAFARGVNIFRRDGSLPVGLLIGLFFSSEFLFLFYGLQHTDASRSVLFMYTSPFFVAIGAIFLLPGERMSRMQWAGLLVSFLGVAVAVGDGLIRGGESRTLFGDFLSLMAGLGWAATTLTLKRSRLATAPFEKVLFYQLAVATVVGAVLMLVTGERITVSLSAPTVGVMIYQTLWVTGITYLVWFKLMSMYPAGPLQSATTMTPLFGIAAGVAFLGEPMSPGFGVAVALMLAGLVLVSRRSRTKARAA
ncbi:DMT family transporter [Segnochrobactraceae bacterium EtOH-i3]